MLQHFIKISQYNDPKKTMFLNHTRTPHPQDAAFRTHIHDVCEIIYLLSGDVSAVIGEKTYKLPKNSVAFFRANLPHRIRIDSADEPYERYDIIFDESKLANQIFYEISRNVDVINCAGDRSIADLFQKLDYYPQHFAGENLDILMRGIIEELLFNLSLMSDEASQEGILTVHPLIGSAIAYINEHYTEPITVEDICKHLNITKSYLHRLFTDELQISPKKYVNVRRLGRAQKLIRRGERPSHIYTTCGFSEYATFFRNYLEHFGHSPSAENEIEIERKIKS